MTPAQILHIVEQVLQGPLVDSRRVPSIMRQIRENVEAMEWAEQQLDGKGNDMNDGVLGHLREARAEIMIEQELGYKSREQSITLTQIDTAILWRQEDLRLKQPETNQTQPGKE